MYSSLYRVFPWAIVAVLALIATWFATQNFALSAHNAELRSQTQLTNVAYKMAQNQLAERSLLAEGMINDLGRKLQRTENLARLEVKHLSSPASTATSKTAATVIWDPVQLSGLIVPATLPSINEDQAFQIWLIDSTLPRPVSVGVFHPEPDGKILPITFTADQPVTQATAFSISLEKKGGAATAEGPTLARTP
jgi:hypothetical protein